MKRNRKNYKIIYTIVLLFFCVWLCGNQSYAAKKKNTVKKITLKMHCVAETEKEYSMDVEEYRKIFVKATPSAAVKKITYKSSNSKVASVNKHGKVKALKPGTARITVTVISKNKKKKRTWVDINVEDRDGSHTLCSDYRTEAKEFAGKHRDVMDEILEQVNNMRIEVGAKPLKYNETLNEMAAYRSYEQAVESDYFENYGRWFDGSCIKWIDRKYYNQNARVDDTKLTGYGYYKTAQIDFTKKCFLEHLAVDYVQDHAVNPYFTEVGLSIAYCDESKTCAITIVYK